nr:hypothetical protein [uncultured Sphaerochaeta sp.]
MTKTLFSSEKQGYCRICGNFRKLTADHIPPESCFNSTPVYVNLPYSARIEKGLKIKSICAECNSTLLGGMYDKELKMFISQIRSHYLAYSSSEGATFHRGKIFIDKVKVLRGLLGHILACYGTQDELKLQIDLNEDSYTNRMRKFVRGEDNNFYQEIRVLFWIHPYDSIRIVPSFTMATIDNPNSIFGGTQISFYPLGFLILNIDAHCSITENIFNELKIDGKSEMIIDLSIVHAEDYPFNLLASNRRYFALLNTNSIIHGINQNLFISNPRELKFFDLLRGRPKYHKE